MPRLGLVGTVRFGMLAFCAAMVLMGSATTGRQFAAGVILAGAGAVMMPVLTGMIVAEAAEGKKGSCLAALESLQTFDRTISYKVMSGLFASSIEIDALPVGLCYYCAAVAVSLGAAVFEATLAVGRRKRL